MRLFAHSVSQSAIVIITISSWPKYVVKAVQVVGPATWQSFQYALRRFFFFSSRRRHTRSDRDWSSDVCSSDLLLTPDVIEEFLLTRRRDGRTHLFSSRAAVPLLGYLRHLGVLAEPVAEVACRSEEHTSELQSRSDLVCRLLLEKKKKNQK